MGALSVTVHEVVHVACQNLTILSFRMWYIWVLCYCMTSLKAGFVICLNWYVMILLSLASLAVTLIAAQRGHWGVPNTATPQEKLENTKMPCPNSTKYRYRILWLVTFYLKLYPSREFATSSMYAPEINFRHREKTWEDLELIGITIEKPGHYH